MRKYSLETNTSGEWELERDFSDLANAISFGTSRFSQNQWRIFDRIAGEVCYRYSPGSAFIEQANQELARFRSTDEWRDRFRQRRVDQESARAADRQRRLSRFNFVGMAPVTPALPIFDIHEGEDDEEEVVVKAKVNWKREGF